MGEVIPERLANWDYQGGDRVPGGEMIQRNPYCGGNYKRRGKGGAGTEGTAKIF